MRILVSIFMSVVLTIMLAISLTGAQAALLPSQQQALYAQREWAGSGWEIAPGPSATLAPQEQGGSLSPATDGGGNLVPPSDGGGGESLPPEGSAGSPSPSLPANSPEPGGLVPDPGEGGAALPPEESGQEAVQPDSGSVLRPADEGQEQTASLGAQALDANSVIVYSYADLSTALSQDNGYNTIYFGADINGSSGSSIRIHANKRNVRIIGQHPDTGVRYTYTEPRRDSINGTIYADTASIGSVAFENMDIVGSNGFGVCNVSQSNDSYANFKLTLKDVTYTGPHAAYNPWGIVRLEDFRFRSEINGADQLGNVAMARVVETAGQIDIDHNADYSTATVFVFTKRNASYPNSLTMEGSTRAQIVTQTSLLYCSSGTLINWTVKSGADVKMETEEAIIDTGTVPLGDLIVEDNAHLNMQQINSITPRHMLHISGVLSVGEGSTFIAERHGGAPALIWLQNSKSLQFNNPKQVRLYSRQGELFLFSQNAQEVTVDILADTINLWQSNPTPDDSIDNMPTGIWNKDDTAEPVDLQLVYSADGTLKNLVSSNLIPGVDPVIEPLTDPYLSLKTAKTLVLGEYLLTGAPFTNRVTGQTVGEAALKVTYGSPKKEFRGMAEASGQYSVIPPAGEPIPLDEEVVILSHHNYTKARKIGKTEQGEDMSLRFDYVPFVDFGTVTLSPENLLVMRTDPDWHVMVYDGRGPGSQWRVSLALADHLKTTLPGGGSDSLTNMLYYGEKSTGLTLPMQPGVPLLVHQGTTSGAAGSPAASTRIDFAPLEGPLLILSPGRGMVGQTYSAELHWSLYSTP